MTTQSDARALTDGLSRSIYDLRTLMGAMDDQLLFYLSNPRLLGEHPNGALLQSCAEQVGGLLALCQTVLAQTDENVEALADFLYRGTQAEDP